MGRHRVPADREAERGQILVLFAIVLTVILAFAALVLDLGLLRNNRQSLANAMDAGAQVGGSMMPVDGSATRPVGDPSPADVDAKVNAAVQATFAGLQNPGNYTISYKCLIGIKAGDAGAFDSADIDAFVPLDCDPTTSLGRDLRVGDFTGAGPTRSVACDPHRGDRCNVIIVAGNVNTEYSFARVVGVDRGNTGAVTSAACRGLCGELPNDDFDVVLVIDDSSSMGDNRSAGRTRSYWAKKAANELIDSLEATNGNHQVGAVRYSGAWDSRRPPAPAQVLSPLTTDLTAVRTAIAPLVGNGGATPLKQGMALGASTLTAGARNGTIRVIVFVSDGRSNPDTFNTARPRPSDIAAFHAAANQVYSVAIGQGGTGPHNPDLPLMRSLAKPDDGSHFYHVVNANALPDVFRQIAVDILNPRSHLIQVYPAPVVTSVGGGSSVAISGRYFSGADSVTIGGAQVVFTVNSDTSITATAPSGTSGDSVQVRVTTQGGTSPATGNSLYTFP